MSELRTLPKGAGARAAATVNGEELFFESSAAPLSAAPEAFATALLLVAATNGARLAIAAPLDPVWRRNAEVVLGVWNRWWGTSADADRILPPLGVVGPRGPAPDGAGRVGLCFTLGVDSFYTLLRSGRRIDMLVFAEGYDVRLGDATRMAPIHDALRDVADHVDAEPVVVRTNLRQHPVTHALDWPRGHGAALAAVGHACGGAIEELVISSTKPVFANRPWGSHWETDPWWSSSRVRFTHFGAERRRNAKLAALVDEPLVRRHLRVCWENRAPSGNCGECEKCVRTMLILAAHGRLAAFEAFPQERSLAAAIDSVRAVGHDSVPVYREAVAELRDRRLRAAVSRLIERSTPRQGSRLTRAAARLRRSASR